MPMAWCMRAGCSPMPFHRGPPAGTTTGEVPRTFLAAFNSTTGALITSFDPTITSTSTSLPGVYSLAVSPDGSTLYVGGTFDHVNGSYRDNLAAFNTSTGALTSWAPAATSKVRAIAVSPSGSQIYLGGEFNDSAPRPGRTANVCRRGRCVGEPAAVGPGGKQHRVHPRGGARRLPGPARRLLPDPQRRDAERGWRGGSDDRDGQRSRGARTLFRGNPGTCTSDVKNIVISGSTAYLGR